MTKTCDISRIHLWCGCRLILHTEEIERYLSIQARIRRMHSAYHRRHR